VAAERADARLDRRLRSGDEPDRARRRRHWATSSALTFLVGGVVASGISGTVDVGVLLPFAAGSFLYIAAVDLIPQLAASAPCAADPERHRTLHDKLEQSGAFAAGLAILLVVAVLT
jgi:zinc and cadmium transporter